MTRRAPVIIPPVSQNVTKIATYLGHLLWGPGPTEVTPAGSFVAAPVRSGLLGLLRPRKAPRARPQAPPLCTWSLVEAVEAGEPAGGGRGAGGGGGGRAGGAGGGGGEGGGSCTCLQNSAASSTGPHNAIATKGAGDQDITSSLTFSVHRCSCVLRHTAGLKTEEVKCTHRAGRFDISQPL